MPSHRCEPRRGMVGYRRNIYRTTKRRVRREPLTSRTTICDVSVRLELEEFACRHVCRRGEIAAVRNGALHKST